MTSIAERRLAANEIISRHLSSGASDPVNVDSYASQAAHDGLDAAEPDLFEQAQRQIYNLMKFDSFSRFLKSGLYQESLTAEIAGQPLPLDTDQDQVAKVTKKKVEQPRRRSLLPSWNHFRSSSQRSKSRDRDKQKLEEDSSEVEDCTLARVILPDKATTVVNTKSEETIRTLVARLLEKRGLKFTSFDVFATTGPQTEKPLDLASHCSVLGCTEVRVEPRVLFRLELPSKKSIGVKAKPAKIVKDVLGPILNQYGWNLSEMIVTKDHGNTVEIPLGETVSSIDNCRLIVSHRSFFEDTVSIASSVGSDKTKPNVSL